MIFVFFKFYYYKKMSLNKLIDWKLFSANPSIFELDYNKMK